MRVIVPYNELSPKVVQAIKDQGYEPELFDTSGDDYSYYDTIAGIWKEGEGFVIVEHDILIPPGGLDSFKNCTMDWCAFPYQTQWGRIIAFGCTRFSTAMVRSRISLFDGIARCKWDVLDSYVGGELQHFGYAIHPHDGEARHLRYAMAAVGFVHPPTVDVGFATDLIRLWTECPEMRGSLITVPEGEGAQDQLVEEFLTTNCDALLVVDVHRPISVDGVKLLVLQDNPVASSDGVSLIRREVYDNTD